MLLLVEDAFSRRANRYALCSLPASAGLPAGCQAEAIVCLGVLRYPPHGGLLAVTMPGSVVGESLSSGLELSVMAYTLPPLPYAFDALEPHIDARTMEIHHDKHHAAYIANVNKALEGSPLADMPVNELISDLEQVPEAIRTAVRNNGGGHANHTLFWESMAPGKGGEPTGALADAIRGQLGGYEKLKDDFSKAAMTRFGSGWAWLSAGANGKLLIESTANQDSPLMHGNKPLLGIDVWEHAYYLHYQNRRADYVAAFFNVIDWDVIGQRFASL